MYIIIIGCIKMMNILIKRKEKIDIRNFTFILDTSINSATHNNDQLANDFFEFSSFVFSKICKIFRSKITAIIIVLKTIFFFLLFFLHLGSHIICHYFSLVPDLCHFFWLFQLDGKNLINANEQRMSY